MNIGFATFSILHFGGMVHGVVEDVGVLLVSKTVGLEKDKKGCTLDA